jgi:hypothetical protein
VLDLIAKGHISEPQIRANHAPSACEQRQKPLIEFSHTILNCANRVLMNHDTVLSFIELGSAEHQV